MLSFPMYEDFRDDFVARLDSQPGTAARDGRPPSSKLPRVSAPVAIGAPVPKIFSGMFARRPIAMNVGIDGQTERVPAELVSGTYFQGLANGLIASWGLGRLVGRQLYVASPETIR